MKTVLVVAAEPFELEYIRDRAGVRFVKIAGGAGPGLAAAAMDRALAASPHGFDCVVSTGLCGALDPGLRIGDVFVADTVNAEATRRPPKVSAQACRFGSLLSIDRIVGSVAERRQWFQAGYAAVEMEAAAVMERARRLGVPFYCIRAVSDAADEEFVLDLNAARDVEGRIRTGRILRQALKRPAAVFPELLRLRRNAGVAARASGAFFATCDF